jgi:hypothetical protein
MHAKKPRLLGLGSTSCLPRGTFVACKAMEGGVRFSKERMPVLHLRFIHIHYSNE